MRNRLYFYQYTLFIYETIINEIKYIKFYIVFQKITKLVLYLQ